MPQNQHNEKSTKTTTAICIDQGQTNKVNKFVVQHNKIIEGNKIWSLIVKNKDIYL